MKNRGYITIEASLVIPLFLFFMLTMSGIYMILLAEAHIHQSLAAATDYTAKQYYLKRNMLLSSTVKSQFHTYLRDDYYVDYYVDGGSNGVSISVERDRNNKNIILVTAKYKAKLVLPLLGTYSLNLSNQIKQKTFVGFTEEDSLKQESYVYITPNREAYHMRRDCTHLLLDVSAVSSHQKGNYQACHYCKAEGTQGVIYIAKNGTVYHNDRGCVGLKRTVRRVNRKSVEGLGACTRCAR